MIAKERQNQIIDLLNKEKLVNAQELARQFGVSIVTIRRDLDVLVDKGIANRIYGGATLVESAPRQVNQGKHPAPNLLAPDGKAIYSDRINIRRAEKIAIAQKAVDMIHDGDTIYIGRGTTAAEMAPMLKSKRGLTVVTCSLAVMNALYDCDNITVFSLGGMLHSKEASLAGNIAMSVVSNFYLDCAFLGAAGITLDGGMTEYYYDTVDLRKMVMSRSKRNVLLVDSSKFGLKTFAVVCDLSALDAIITDAGISPEDAYGIQQMNVDLIIVDPEKGN